MRRVVRAVVRRVGRVVVAMSFVVTVEEFACFVPSRTKTIEIVGRLVGLKRSQIQAHQEEGEEQGRDNRSSSGGNVHSQRHHFTVYLQAVRSRRRFMVIHVGQAAKTCNTPRICCPIEYDYDDDYGDCYSVYASLRSCA